VNLRRLLPAIPIALAIPLVTLWLSVGWRPPTQDELLWSDLAWYFMPTFAVLHRSLTDGFAPLWNPWQLAGWPFLAAFQTQAVYAPAWAVAWLPPHLAVTVYNVMHWSWAFVGMVTLAFGLGLGSAAAIAAAGAYAISGPLVNAFFIHSASLAVMSWLPWCAAALVAVMRSGAEPASRAVIALSVCLAGALLAGAPEHFMYMQGALLVIALWQGSGMAAGDRRRVVGRLAVSALLVGLLCAAQILPTVELMRHAVRSAGGFDRADIASFPVAASDLARAVGGLDGGVGRISMLLLPLCAAGLLSRRTRKGTALVLVAGLLVLDHLRGSGGFVFPFLYDWMPLFRSFRVHLRAEFVWIFCGSLALALGVEAVDAALAPRGPAARAGAWLLVALLFVDLSGRLFHDRCFIPLSDPGVFYGPDDLRAALEEAPGPERIFVQYGLASEGLHHKFGQTHGAHDVAEYDALVPARYKRLFQVPDEALWMGRLQFESRSKMAAGKSVVIPGVDLAALDLLSARYYLSKAGPSTSWIEDVTRGAVRYRGDFNVVERRAARPRAYIVHEAIAAAGDSEALAALRKPSFDPARSAIITGTPPRLEAAPAGAVETAKVVVDDPNRVVVDATCASRCLLVLTDLDFPGWSATVDTVEAPILTANYLVRAVVLDAGRHRVEYAYRPVPAMVGAAVSLLTLAALTAALLRRSNRVPQDATG
jgi:hypothetical protein